MFRHTIFVLAVTAALALQAAAAASAQTQQPRAEQPGTDDGLEAAWATDRTATSPPASPDTADLLDRLVREAVEASPRVAAARAGAEAAGERISRAGAWEDPVLSGGFMNLRATSLGFGDDPMTMKTVQLSQRLPLPGQLGGAREAARERAGAQDHRVEAVAADVAAEVKRVYADLYYLDRALEVTDRNLELLGGIERVVSTRYATGVEGQPGALRTQIEVDALEERRIALEGRRARALARLNELLDRPPGTPLPEAPYPAALASLLGARPGSSGGHSSADRVGTESSGSLFVPSGGTGIAGEGTDGEVHGLPPLEELLDRALEARPELRAREADVRAGEAEVRRARADRWPAPRLSVGYAQRSDHPDFLQATVSLEIPLFAGSRQAAEVREERARLARAESLRLAAVREVEAEVTEAYASMVEAYERTVFHEDRTLIRVRANMDATFAAYRADAEDFLTLLESQAALYRHQLEHQRRMADLLRAWADLERAVGGEVLP